MGIILDLILLAILVLSIIMGYKKGLIGVVFSFCAFIVSIIVTVILYNPISNFVINNTELDDNLKNIIIENGIIKDENVEEDAEKNVGNYIDKYISNAVTDVKNNVVENSAGIVAEKVVAIGVAIVLFIVVRITLIFLKFIVEGISSLPIIKQFNKLGGTLYGILRGAIIIYAVLAIMFFIVSLTNLEVILSLINTSFVSKFLYANNIILNILF